MNRTKKRFVEKSMIKGSTDDVCKSKEDDD